MGLPRQNRQVHALGDVSAADHSESQHRYGNPSVYRADPHQLPWNIRPWIQRMDDWRFFVSFENFVEEIQVLGKDLVEKVKALIHEGNVNRIIIKDDKGNTYVEIPVTVAAVGAIAAPVLAALGAISALVAKFKIE